MLWSEGLVGMSVGRLLLLGTVAGGVACSAAHHEAHAVADVMWTPAVARPAFTPGEGPVVAVDEAHGNWHTASGRFAPFAELLRSDGFRVRSATEAISEASLAGIDVLVIANAVLGGEDSEWVLPTPPALASREVETLARWVESGGSLLLIADHMPFPAAVANLAEAFGIAFLNGFAKPSATESGTTRFTRSSGSLADHPITRGRNDSESVPWVKSFTGQAFAVPRAAEPLMAMPDDWVILFPRKAWEFERSTPTRSTRGLVQGAVLRRGTGRVAVFGEAAMFTAQSFERDGRTVRVGLNDPEASHNAQFVLNVTRWLCGILDPGVSHERTTTRWQPSAERTTGHP